jgi:signal transduction histidine kinase
VATMNDVAPPLIQRQGVRLGLSARLLLLTVAFVMLSELFIYAPSIAQFRKSYLEKHIASADLATIALDETFGVEASPEMEAALLQGVGAYGIILRHPERKILALSDEMPPMADVIVDLRSDNFLMWMGDAFQALGQDRNRVMRVMGPSPRDPNVLIEVVMDEAPMVREMYVYSGGILSLSIVISLVTAGLVYLSLQWLLVRPMRRITASMTAFRADPEDEGRIIVPAARGDEIGVAQRELAVMQSELRAALRQKTRLATLGAAVAKINHDLRNSLSTAVLVSDRLADIDDPEVKKVTPRLYDAIDRAVKLCSQTLNFVRDLRPALNISRFPLSELVDGVGAELTGETPEAGMPVLANAVPAGLTVEADREQLFRAVSNLVRNAREAGAREVRVAAAGNGDTVCLEIADDGPGMPEKARQRLFQPFAGSARKGGTGLGLVIARDIMKAHGGDLVLADTGSGGTVFRVSLPSQRVAARS